MQPKIKSKVRCTDREVGEITRVIVDPLSKEISHIVVRTGGGERLIATDQNVSACTEEGIELSFPSAALSRFEPFRREEYVQVKEVEIPHLERHLDVIPGEALVPIPDLEKNIARRTFLQRFTNVIGLVLSLPLLYPAFKYIIHPMYRPLDNTWIKMGRAEQFRELDVPRLVKFPKTVKEGFLEREYEKSHWAMKASPEMLEKIYQDRETEFKDQDGKVIWENNKESDIVVFSGKCPHLGCAFRWRKHKRFGQSFVCPCHLSVFDPAGILMDGPSPRPLDILPVKLSGKGDIEIIDAEFKAGKEERIRIV
ncbi:MAG: ubiquinol-cytochrome c reductase iron-sulfur subunit [Nitrospirota bacterium]